MVFVQSTVLIVTVYFFIKVWKSPPKPEEEVVEKEPD